MKTFFKDYGQLVKQTGAFYKNHWLGIIIISFVSGFVTVLLVWPKWMRDDVVDIIKSKFKKNKKDKKVEA